MQRSTFWRDRNRSIVRARALRREPTPSECRLWEVLRRRPEGLKFRRQHPFPGCTVDFYCPAAKLVIEVDGDSHSMGDAPERDSARDQWLAGQGITVVRNDAKDVMRNLDGVVLSILEASRR
ncbi:MAG TPA: endonuclease domain-containing protein [Allosphingosinicella sp.]